MKFKINKMDIILYAMFITMICFICIMIFLFYKFQSVPDTLIIAVFGLFTGECGIMGWIKNTKEKTRNDRELVEVKHD